MARTFVHIPFELYAEGVPSRHIGASFVVKTSRDLQDALSAPDDTMIFVESIMDPYDALAPITNSSNNKGADLDYGPRGPQHRENLQLRPAAY